MTYDFQPDPSYAYVTRKGDRGESVAALQVNLYGVPVDGKFGSQTKAAVWGFQEKHNLTVDGICGLATQQRICVAGSAGARKAYDLPKGLLKSLMANESGFALAAFSWHPSDAGFDLGPYQDSIGPGGADNDRYHHSYSVAEMAEQVAKGMSIKYQEFDHPVPSWYLSNIGLDNEARFAWQLAVLQHNWPYAAHKIAERGHIFNDAAQDTQDAEWVIKASGGRLRSGRDWVVSYIAKGTVFVSWL